MSLNFEWDPVKTASNVTRHGVSFTLAMRVFENLDRIERHDGRDDYGEDRFVTVGLVGDKRLTVPYTMRGDTIRIISARKATRNEHLEYW